MTRDSREISSSRLANLPPNHIKQPQTEDNSYSIEYMPKKRSIQVRDNHIDDKRFQNYGYTGRKLPSWFKREFETDNDSIEERKIIPVK